MVAQTELEARSKQLNKKVRTNKIHPPLILTYWRCTRKIPDTGRGCSRWYFRTLPRALILWFYITMAFSKQSSWAASCNAHYSSSALTGKMLSVKGVGFTSLVIRVFIMHSSGSFCRLLTFLHCYAHRTCFPDWFFMLWWLLCLPRNCPLLLQ